MLPIPSQPLVTIVIPFFNRINVTCKALQSALQQSYKNIEVILISDGSIDDDKKLVAIINDLDYVVYIKLLQNYGPSIARNAGIDAAKGEYIAFLDSDDQWDCSKLEVQMHYMIKNNWSFSHTSYYRYNLDLRISHIIHSGTSNYRFPFIAFRCMIATPTVIVKRDLLMHHKFRTDLRFGEDIFLWLECSKKVVLHGVDRSLTHVFVNDETTASNYLVAMNVLETLGKDGLKDHPFLQVIHMCYRFLRKTIRK